MCRWMSPNPIGPSALQHPSVTALGKWWGNSWALCKVGRGLFDPFCAKDMLLQHSLPGLLRSSGCKLWEEVGALPGMSPSYVGFSVFSVPGEGPSRDASSMLIGAEDITHCTLAWEITGPSLRRLTGEALGQYGTGSFLRPGHWALGTEGQERASELQKRLCVQCLSGTVPAKYGLPCCAA